MSRGESTSFLAPAPTRWDKDETERSAVDTLGDGDNPPAQLKRGTVVGRYTVLSLVGRGGMSEVYGAYDPVLDRKVALKLLHSDSSGSECRQARLYREGRAIAQISHPNVISVHEMGTFGDRVFMVIEHIEGRTLLNWLQELPRSPAEILDFFLQAANGLAAAHAKGLIHRDFKPQNVLVSNDGHVRVTDFGLAQWIDQGPVLSAPAPPLGPRTIGVDLTKTGHLVGTPLYMAPEQLDGGSLDARTDQFAFCVALYDALYGEHPFLGEEGSTGLRAAIAAGMVRDAPSRGAVPGWRRRVILRGLSVAPASRWPGMNELAAALMADPAGRRPWRWFVGGVALVAVVAPGAAMRTHSRASVLVCEEGRNELQGVWPAENGGWGPRSSRAAVRAAFLGTGAATAGEVWDHTATLLDRYASGWVSMYRQNCEATSVRSTRSRATLDQQKTCLEERRGALLALVDVFTTADAAMLSRAVDAARALPPVELCGDPRSWNTAAPLDEPAVRREVDDLRGQARSAQAEHDAGRDRQAIAQARALLLQARTIGYVPLVAELLSLIGMSEAAILDPRAPQTLEEALWASLRAGRDDLAAQASSRLAGIVSIYLNRPNEGERWAKLSEVSLERLGEGNERLRSWLLNDRAVMQLESGHLEEALKLVREALGIKRRALSPDDPDIARSLLTEAETLHRLGRDREALAKNDEARRLLAPVYGPNAVIVSQTLSNRGEYLAALRRYPAALASFQDALSHWQSEMGPGDQFCAYPLTGIGRTLLALGRTGEARLALENAWRIRETNEPNLAVRAETALALARALWETGERRRARALIRIAHADYRKSLALHPPEAVYLSPWPPKHS